MIFGSSLKDRLTNLAAAIGLVGSILLVGTEAGWVPASYAKSGQGMLGVAAVFTAYATGKRADLMGSQKDKSLDPPNRN